MDFFIEWLPIIIAALSIVSVVVLVLKVTKLKVSNAKLETKLEEKQTLLDGNGSVIDQLKDSFKALSADTLKLQGDSFGSRFDKLFETGHGEISNIARSLKEKIEQLKEQGGNNAAQFKQQMIDVAEESRRLGKQTQGLKDALRKPHVRGGWAEQNLQNALKASGLREGIDYTTQENFDHEGKNKRTDFVVNMPEGRRLIIDSKISLEALIDNDDADNQEQKKFHSERHVKQIKKHVEDLAKREYPQAVKSSPDFVVMVLQESDFFNATNRDLGLIEWAISKNVIIVTPPALVALLRALDLTWKQVRVVEKSQEISELSKKLYHHLAVFSERYVKIGTTLRKTVECYNGANRVWDRDLSPQIEQFKNLELPVSGEIRDTSDVIGPNLINRIPCSANSDESGKLTTSSVTKS